MVSRKNKNVTIWISSGFVNPVGKWLKSRVEWQARSGTTRLAGADEIEVEKADVSETDFRGMRRVTR